VGEMGGGGGASSLLQIRNKNNWNKNPRRGGQALLPSSKINEKRSARQVSRKNYKNEELKNVSSRSVMTKAKILGGLKKAANRTRGQSQE